MDKGKLTKNMDGSTYVLAEYNVLRDELNHLNASIFCIACVCISALSHNRISFTTIHDVIIHHA